MGSEAMPTLRIRFPGRRYHATPWGHHVNEGLIEWPPSPWRLLRALLATGYAKCHWPSDGPPEMARSLIEKLASVVPIYRLPEAVGTHSRHYMPLARFKNGQEETTLVFDTWAQVDSGEFLVRWDVEINHQERAELARLADGLSYLGRSESWTEAALVDDDRSGDDAYPCGARDLPRPGWEQVALLAPLPAPEYASWRDSSLAQARNESGIDLAKNKHTAGERKKLDGIDSSFPSDLLAALQVDTVWLHQLGWSQPPGSRKLLYWRRSDSLESAAPRPSRAVAYAEPVECMLLAIATQSGNLHALPRIERALPQSELLHRSLIANASRAGGHSIALSGCDNDGKPLRLSHQHAHLIHLDLDADGHLDHVLIWAPMGLDAQAQSAVRATRKTYTKGGTGPLRLALAGAGSLAGLSGLPNEFGATLARLLGSPTGGLRWRSVTPFVPPRHLKKIGRHSLVGQVTAELTARGLPEPLQVRVLDPRDDEAARRARHFQRSRSRGAPPPQDCGFVLEIKFATQVQGPIAIGYGCHLGMGLFADLEHE